MILIAHRGYSGKYPENTLISFQKAIEAGAQYIEYDIQYTRDKNIAVIHDFTLDRTTNASGKVVDLTLKEIKIVSAGYHKKFGDSYTNERILTLDETVSFCKNKTAMLIEIKREDHHTIYDDGLEEKALQIIADNDVNDKIIFLSFNLNSVSLIKKLAPNIIVGSLFYKIDEDAIAHSHEIGASYIIFNYRTKPSSRVIDRAKKVGCKVGLYTIDNRKDFKKHASMVDAIATNYFKEMNDYFLRFF